MKHLYLPLPIETVRKAWEQWREANAGSAEDVQLVEVRGGCFLVTQARPPKVFVDLLKGFLESKSDRLARAG